MNATSDIGPAIEALQRVFAGESLADVEGVSPQALEETYEQARELVEREDFEGALAPLMSLVAYNPYETRFQFAYGLCLHQLGEVESAAKHYGLAYMLDPTDAACAFRLGECHVALDDRDAAIEAFQTAIELCAAPDAPSDVRLMAEEALDLLNA